jgi:hypothetical protein
MKPAPLVAPKLKANQRAGAVSVSSIAVWFNGPELVVVPEAYQPAVLDGVQDYLVHAGPRFRLSAKWLRCSISIGSIL